MDTDIVLAEKLEQFLYRAYCSGFLMLDGVRQEARALGLPRPVEQRLMERCVSSLYGVDWFDRAA
jgi:hypothetical protein